MPLATQKWNTIYYITAIHVNFSSTMACIIIIRLPPEIVQCYWGGRREVSLLGFHLVGV